MTSETYHNARPIKMTLSPRKSESLRASIRAFLNQEFTCREESTLMAVAINDGSETALVPRATSIPEPRKTYRDFLNNLEQQLMIKEISAEHWAEQAFYQGDEQAPELEGRANYAFSLHRSFLQSIRTLDMLASDAPINRSEWERYTKNLQHFTFICHEVCDALEAETNSTADIVREAALLRLNSLQQCLKSWTEIEGDMAAVSR